MSRKSFLSLLILAVLTTGTGIPFIPSQKVYSGHEDNGTIKVHEANTDDEPSVNNEPHVCTFHFHGFNFDGSQSGTWHVEKWAPGDGKGDTVLDGSYSAGNDGSFRNPGDSAYSLPEGHYKLFWQDNNMNKQKVFWVGCNKPEPTPEPTCDHKPTPTQTPRPTCDHAPTGTPTATPTPATEATGTVTPTPTTSGGIGGSDTGSSNHENSSGSSTENNVPAIGDGDVLGVSTLADTGTADIRLAWYAVCIGMIIAAGSTYGLAKTGRSAIYC